MEIQSCKGNVRELLALELFARARLGPGPILANRLRIAEQTMSASLAYGARRVPGQRKSKGQPENECIHFQVCPFDFRGASRRPTGEAGRPGTVVGVKTSWRKLSQQERRQTQVSLHSFLLSVCRRQTKDVRFCESPSDARASRREQRGAIQKESAYSLSVSRKTAVFVLIFPSHHGS